MTKPAWAKTLEASRNARAAAVAERRTRGLSAAQTALLTGAGAAVIVAAAVALAQA